MGSPFRVFELPDGMSTPIPTSPSDFRALVSSVLRGDIKKPSDESFRIMYGTYKMAVLEAKFVPPPTEHEKLLLSDVAQTAAKTIFEELDKWEQVYNLTINEPTGEPEVDYERDRHSRKQKRKIRRARTAILDLGYIINPLKPLPEDGPFPSSDWRCYAWSLAFDFRRGIETTNPGRTLGLSHDGPVARYIVAVMPTITGESLTAGQVSKFLQRSRGG